MIRNAKAKGARLEREVKDRLKKAGCIVVRQAASLFPDLICILPVEPGKEELNKRLFFIECKCRKYISSEERKLLMQIELRFGGKSIIAYKHKGKMAFCGLNYNAFPSLKALGIFATII